MRRPPSLCLPPRAPSWRGHLVRAALLLACAAAALAPAARAQTGFAAGSQDPFAGTLFASRPDLFGEGQRIKLLVLGLQPFGLTESAAEQIGLILEKNLQNTDQFAVVGARELNAVFEKQRPDLVDCRAIACGVESGKLLGADQVLVGTIRMDNQVFSLQVRLINTANNLADHEDRVRFTDESLEEDLFGLVNNISRNALHVGRVLSTSIKGLVIGLGKKHGLQIGDSLVIYKEEVPINNLQGQKVDTQRKNIAIVKTLNVNDNSSDAIIIHSTEDPQVGHYVKTYLNPTRQIELIENTRRELDTGIRLANKLRPLELAPVLLADTEKKNWQRRRAEAEIKQQQWTMLGTVGGLATLAFLNTYEDTDDARLRLLAAAGFTAYAFVQALDQRDVLNDLQVEGRAKGYLGWDWRLEATPDAVRFVVAYNF